MKYDVTIGIPVYNSEDYVRRAVMSALEQTYPSIEFLVIEDGCDDRSADIVREIMDAHPRGSDIHIVNHSKNKGVSASRNRIIEEAQGKYLFFMDSDDEIATFTISLLMEQIRRYDAEIVFGSYERIETNGKRTFFQYPFISLLGKDALAGFAYRKYGGIQASACNFLVNLSFLRRSQLRFVDVDYWEDMAFTFNLVVHVSRAVLLSDITYFYYCRENSLSHYQNRTVLPKEEIVKNIGVVDYLKETSLPLYGRSYYPKRCYLIMMTDFYVACNILKRRNQIVPSMTNQEIRRLFQQPASLRQILGFRQAQMKNIFFYLLGKLPPSLCVMVVRIVGKMKKLV